MSEKSSIAVAMSGGVDSSVAAGLMARSERPLVGFSMQLVDTLQGETERYGRCCSPEDFRDARRVAERLGFPHYVLDMEDDFKKHVLAPFADDYAHGRTPSPCVRCNTYIKFGALIGRSRAVGSERVATGHYAILEKDPKSGRTLLRKAVDDDKDQSYFLFDLSETQRQCAEFPLGHLQKDEVRELAREMGLANSEKPESMDLCFVGKDESYRDYLERNGADPDARAGSIVDGEGNTLGEHDGIDRFTVGQRRGIGISSNEKLYVIQVKPETREVVVGSEDGLWKDSCIIERTRWIPFERPKGPLRAQVRIRSNHVGSPATIQDRGDGTAEIRFDDPEKAISPGQAAVAYDGDLVLGGGWIVG